MAAKKTINHANRIFMPILVIAFLLLVAFVVKHQDGRQVQAAQSTIANLLTDINSEQKNIFVNFIETQHRHLGFLSETPPVQELSQQKINYNSALLDNMAEIWTDRLAIIFSSLANTYSDISQVRLIDATTGVELVRVDKIGQNTKRITAAKLQDKSETDYVTKTIKLAEGSVYISDLDLNRENGVIEYPIKPTIRFALPLYNQKKHLYALLIINVSAQQLLKQLQNVSMKHNVQFSLVDHHNNIIEHVNDAYHFTKDLSPALTWNKIYNTAPWYKKPLKLTNERNNNTRYITLFNQLKFAPIEVGGAYQFTFINSIAEAQYEEILMAKRLSSLGYFTIVMVIFIVISIILLFYIRSVAQLRKTRTAFSAIIEGASDGIIAINDKLHIESYNAAAAKFFPELNTTKASLALTDITNFSPKLITELVQSASCDNTSLHIKSTNNTANLLIKRSPILNDKNIKIGDALFIQDISEQTRYEDEIKEINASLETQILERTVELEQAIEDAVNASNIKSQFVSTISHEMRTPLNGILGSLTLMAKERHDEHTNALLDMMNSSATALSTLINDVLDLSKIEAGKLEIIEAQCNVIVVIEETAISLSSQAFNKNIELEFDTSEIKHYALQLDSGRLIQVLNNLIGNALKFTLRGGVYISARTRLIANKVRLEVDIKDTGIGIAAELLPKLFQPFAQADSSIASEFGGTGLGLSISKQLCELMGGQISVLSEKGQGSTFSFYIDTPLDAAKALPDTYILAKTSFKLLMCNEFIRKKWENSVQLFGGVIVDEQPDYFIVDCHHSDYQSIKDDENILARSIFLSRHAETYGYIQDLFAFLNRPTKLASFLQLFSTDKSLLQYFTESAKDQQSSELNYPDLADKTYLVVDDNNINITIACHLLHSVHAKTITANSGVQAIEQLKEAQQNNIYIDAILMDCQMPIMNGYETTERIRKGQAGNEFIATPIIALTANAMSDERDKCIELGMNDYLTKPINTDNLFNTLQKFIVNKQLEVLNEPEKATILSLDQSEALNRLSGNEDLYKKLLIMFIDEAPAKIAALKQLTTSADYEGIWQVGHALKGTTGNISALLLRSLATKLEKASKTEDLPTCTELINLIEIEYQQVAQLIKTKLKGQ